MAHGIYNDNAMMYVGAAPWHGLGVALPQNATWEQTKNAVGFYAAELREVFVAGQSEPVAGLRAVVRPDTNETLSVVSARYGVVQFADLAEAVVAAAGGEAVFHTAGLLGKKGERGWLLGELGEPIRVKGDQSEIRKYFLATSAHDGATCAELLNVGTRVVCQNTLGVALGEKDGARWTIRHTTNAADRVKAAGVAFRNLATGYERFGALANLLAQTKLTAKQTAAVVDAVLPMPVDASEASGSLIAKREKVLELHDTARGIEGLRGTAWGAFQAWTEYADHHSKVRALPADLGARRLESIWFGSAAELKTRALEAIKSVAGARLAA